jgi:hypothetical protein
VSSNTRPSPTSNPTSIPLEILTWHQNNLKGYTAAVNEGIKTAKEELEKQMKFYLQAFSFAAAIATALIGLAGFVGYKTAVNQAVLSVKGSITSNENA